MTTKKPWDPAEILAHYPQRYRTVRAEFPGDRAGFSGAIIVRLHCTVGDFCLRGWPPHQFSERRILGLHRLLRHVSRQGVSQVAVPVAAENGTTLIFVRNRLWQLEPWMPGRADFWGNPDTTRLRAAIECLAHWHRAACSFQPSREESDWFCCKPEACSPAVSERLSLVFRWNNGECERLRHTMATSPRDEFRELGERILQLFERVSPQIAGQLQAARQLRFRLQPCLRDVWHDHVLFTGHEVTGLIDASACRFENVATDLSRLLGSFVGDDHHAWDTALEAYAKHRPLTPDELGLVHLLDRSSVLLSGMTWLEWHYLQAKEFAHPERVNQRLRTIRRRLELLGSAI